MTKIMKKILSVCLVVLMCITAAPLDGFVGLDLGFGTKASAFDATGSLGGSVTYSFDEATGVLTVGGTGATEDYSVNDTYGDSPLYGNKAIKKIVIESGVTDIGNSVFAACGVEEVTFSDTVKTIGWSVFHDCTALKQVNLSASVNSIDANAFYGCPALEKFTVPDDNETYKSVDGILFTKDGKTLYKYPGGKVGTAYTVSASVEKVYDDAFRDSKKLVSIDFENDDTTIGQRAFACCTALKNISLPKNITSLEEGLFYECSSLKDIALPGSVTEICGKVFSGASSLEFIVIPNGVTEICMSTFLNCSSLKGVVIPSSVEIIKNYAFSGATALKDVYYIGTAESWEANVGILSGNTALESVTMHYIDSANKIGDNVYYELDSATGALTIVGSGSTNDYSSSSESPFYNNSSIKSVTIGEGVTSIGNRLFNSATNLESVTFPTTLEKIGRYAFYKCKFEGIIIPEGVKTISPYAFNYCTALKAVVLPSSLKTIGNYSFHLNSALSDVCYFGTEETWKKISIDYCNDPLVNAKRHYVDATKKLGDNVYYEFDSTTGVLTVSGIGDMYDFSGWETAPFSDIKDEVKSIIISEGVTSVGDFAFAYCTSNVENISIARSVTKIGRAAFMSCQKLTSLVISEGVTSIGTNAFRDCYNIESLTLYGNLTSIADSAFGMDAAEELFKLESIYYCGTAEQYTALNIGTNNKFITGDAVTVYYCPTGKLGNNITYTLNPVTGVLTLSGTGATGSYSSGNSPFYGNKDIKKIVIESGVTDIENSVFATCGVEEVTFSDTVKYIDWNAFKDCTALKQANLSASVVSIYGAFNGCTALEKFTVPDDSETYKSVDGILFTKDGKTLYKYPGGKEATAYTVPASVENVYERAFSDSKKLVSIDFENDDTTIIEDYAFVSCTALKNIYLPKNLTILENNLFSGCSSLEFVVLPNNVSSIGYNAFQNCSSLKGVVIPSGVSAINSYAFSGATALKDVYYIGTAESWEANVYIFSNNTTLKSATMHYIDSANKIGDNVYYELDSVTGALTIVGSGKTYDYGYSYSENRSPFYDSADIKSVNVTEGVTSIGNLLFYGCNKVESVTLPDSLKTIGNNSFDSCQSLKSIVIPDNVTTIGRSAFQSTKLETVTLGESLEVIDDLAFYFTNIKSIVIPDSVTTINYMAFGNCLSLESITIGKSLKTIGNAAISRINSLKSITVSEENENFSSVDGVLFNKDKTKLIVYPAKKADNIYFVPTTVKTIGNDAFYGCTNLEMISIPDSVENIGSAFIACSALKKIALPEGISNIIATTFSSCEALECIYIPSSVTSINAIAFDECVALTTVYRSSDVSSPSDCITVGGGNGAYTNATVVPNHTHTPESYYVIKDNSCTQDGSRMGICACGKFFDEETVSAAHTFGEVQHKDADCFNAGYDYKQCTDCKKYFASDAAANATNGKDDTSSFVISATGHSDGKDGNDNLCDNCYAYIGDITLTVGTNISVPITYAYGSRDTLVKFVPDKTAQYIITSNIASDDQNTYPVITVYSLTDASLHYETYDSYGVGKNFNLSTYTFTAGQVYCITFKNYMENAEAYTVNVALGCEHPSSKQTCMGYYCDTCSLYYGDRDSSKHELDTVQTCSGYKCKHCNRYFGEAAPDNHLWNTEGMCTACFTWHDHKSFDENGMCTVCKYALPYVLTSSGTTTYYQKLTDALTAAKDGDTIKMQNDDGEHYLGAEITKAITLDLNGHTMSTPSSDSFAVKANVTFTDSVGGSYCEYGIMLYTSCTFSGGGFRYIAISSDFETEDNLDDYLATCCDYYNYSYIFGSDGGGTVGSLVDLSSKKDTFDLENAVMIKENHSIVEVGAQDATCTESGHTAGEYCENCDYTTITKTSDPTGHTFGSVQHKDADCTSGGYDYKQCSSCNKYFSPDAVENAINGKNDYSSFTTQKLDHSYTGDMKMDTNGKNGTHSYKCVNGCGQYGNATAHEWNNGEITTPASHIKEGIKTYKCACGAEYTEPVSKLEGHSYTPTVVPPTCTEQGYTEHKCACGDSYKDTYVDATGHSYENGSCTECGAPDPSYAGDSGDNTSDCDCLCHSSNKFVQFIYKIVRWFWKLFKIHKTCDCGAIHY